MNDRAVTISDADVVERLARLRAVLALMAGDLAVARRRVRALEIENERLATRVTALESRLAGGRERGRAAKGTTSRTRTAASRLHDGAQSSIT